MATMLAVGEARAQSCTANVSAVAFGYANAGNLNGLTTVGAIGEGCTSGWASFGTLAMCNSFGAGVNSASQNNRTMKLGANSISYQLYSDAAMTKIFQFPGAATVSIPYSATSGGYATSHIYAKILSPATGLPAGIYTDTYGTNANSWVVFDATAPNNPIACGTANSYIGASPAFQVSVNYLGSCQVSSGTLSFGTQSLLNANIDASSSISVTCTAAAPYTVAMGPGLAPGATTSTRQMLGPGGLIGYRLFRDSARTLNWGNQTGVDTYAGTGTGAAQTIPVYGRIPPQSPVSPGTYQDTVIVTLTY